MHPNIVLWDGRKLDKDIFIQYESEGTPVLVQYGVTKAEVRRRDYKRLCEMLDSFIEVGSAARSCLLLTFDGWDFDSRPLVEIDEVRDYIRQIIISYPQIWYFLIPELNTHFAVAQIDCTMVAHPSFPKLANAPGLPPQEQRAVQLDLSSADKQINAMSSAVLAYGMEIGDQRGALDVILKWRMSLNL